MSSGAHVERVAEVGLPDARKKRGRHGYWARQKARLPHFFVVFRARLGASAKNAMLTTNGRIDSLRNWAAGFWSVKHEDIKGREIAVLHVVKMVRRRYPRYGNRIVSCLLAVSASALAIGLGVLLLQ